MYDACNVVVLLPDNEDRADADADAAPAPYPDPDPGPAPWARAWARTWGISSGRLRIESVTPVMRYQV